MTEKTDDVLLNVLAGRLVTRDNLDEELSPTEIAVVKILTGLAKSGFDIFPDRGVAYNKKEGVLIRIEPFNPIQKLSDGKITWRGITIGRGSEKPFDIIYEIVTGQRPKDTGLRLTPHDGDWSNLKWDNINPDIQDIKPRVRGCE